MIYNDIKQQSEFYSKLVSKIGQIGSLVIVTTQELYHAVCLFADWYSESISYAQSSLYITQRTTSTDNEGIPLHGTHSQEEKGRRQRQEKEEEINSIDNNERENVP